MRRVGAVALGLYALTWCSSARAQSLEPRDRYLDGYRGPYTGRVIDAETKAPLAGAVFTARWLRDRIYPLHIATEPYAVRETVTDADGRFLLDARDIEEGAPRRTRRPEFMIFLPGYGLFPRYHTAPQGFLGGIFEGAGATVELPSLKSRQDRRRQLMGIDPYGLSETPFKDLPQLMQRVNDESLAIGVDPYLPPEIP